MNLSGGRKVDSGFSMASMTDIIFLLLVFFMLTSSFVTPSGLPVNLPGSSASKIVMQKVSVTITNELEYFVNSKQIDRAELKGVLRENLLTADQQEGLVVLHIDKDVPVDHLVNVASIATELKAKVSIATKPDKDR